MPKLKDESLLKMIKGDTEEIRKGLFSSNYLLKTRAILWATYNKLLTPEIISRIVDLKNDNEMHMGLKISDYAIASLVVSGIEKYDGDDRNLKDFIDNFLPTVHDVKRILASF